MHSDDIDRQLGDLAGLGDPIRRALYRHVAQRGVPVSRDDAAKAAGISRPLAAYHLDKLVHDGLLESRYQRRSGRQGPGAGRPAKHYVRAERQLALNRAAASLGADLGAEAATRAVPEGDPDQVLAAVRQALATRGYEPYDDADGAIRLRNCPFDRIAARHRELVCGANHAMLGALTDRLGGDPPVRAVLDPQPGRCCVVVRRDG